jgi:hypothetical protein
LDLLADAIASRIESLAEVSARAGVSDDQPSD